MTVTKQRRHLRHEVDVPAAIRDADDTCAGQAVNASPVGLCLLVEKDSAVPNPGTEVEVYLESAGVVRKATVIRVQPIGDKIEIGLGLLRPDPVLVDLIDSRLRGTYFYNSPVGARSY